MRYLLDTNIISEPFKLKPNLAVVVKLQKYGVDSVIASVTWHELIYGLGRLPDSLRKRQLELYLFQTVQPNLPILPYDVQAAEWFADERTRLTALGRPPSYADGQIAAIAATNNLILVTRNVSDYISFVALTIENWFEESQL